MQDGNKVKSIIEPTACMIALLSISCFHFDANAYLNPATGSMILQALIAGLAVVAVTIKLYWFKLRAFLKGEKFEPEEDLLVDLDVDVDVDCEDRKD
jgi:DUF1365 family protein